MTYSFQKFKYFLLQGRFTVVTDNKKVCNWVTMKDPGGTVRRWMEYLHRFLFKVVHCPGKELINADSLFWSTHLLPPIPYEASAAADRAEVHELPLGSAQFQGSEMCLNHQEAWESGRPSSSVHPTKSGCPSSFVCPFSVV